MPSSDRLWAEKLASLAVGDAALEEISQDVAASLLHSQDKLAEHLGYEINAAITLSAFLVTFDHREILALHRLSGQGTHGGKQEVLKRLAAAHARSLGDVLQLSE